MTGVNYCYEVYGELGYQERSHINHISLCCDRIPDKSDFSKERLTLTLRLLSPLVPSADMKLLAAECIIPKQASHGKGGGLK